MTGITSARLIATIFLGLWGCAAAAQQPSAVANMPYASTPFSGAELLYMVQGGVSKKTNASTLQSQLGSILPGAVSNVVGYTGISTLGPLSFTGAGVLGTTGAGLVGRLTPTQVTSLVNLATTSAPGIVQPDGATITISGGVISAVPGALAFGTGAPSAINPTSNNPGFTNDFLVSNTGTGSNPSTGAQVAVSISSSGCVLCNLYNLVQGGATPTASVYTDTGLTGGLDVESLAGPLLLQGFAGVYAESNTGQWGLFNAGKTLLVEPLGPGAINPTVGISDTNSTNWIGFTNSTGTLLIQAMPALTDSTTAPTILMEIATSFGVAVPDGGLTLGTAGGAVGDLVLKNATSGQIALQPATGALGSQVATLPANTGTIAEYNIGGTWTAAQTISVSSSATSFPLIVEDPTLGTGNGVEISLGVAASTYNIATIGFGYAGAGSSSNNLSFGFNGAGNLMTIAGSGVVTVPNTFVTPGLPNLSASVESSGIAGLDNATWFIYSAPTGATSPQSILRVQRSTTFTGGSGHNPYNLWSDCTNTSGDASFVYCTLNQFTNNSTSSAANMVAEYSQMLKKGDSPSWGSVIELDDNIANPTQASVSLEIDAFGFSSDTNSNRVGIDLVAGLIPGQSGYTPTFGRLLRLGAQGGTAANAFITRGISFQPATWDIFMTVEGSVSAIEGIDFSAVSFSGCALCLNANQKIDLNTSSPGNDYLQQTTGALSWHTTTSGVAFQVGSGGGTCNLTPPTSTFSCTSDERTKNDLGPTKDSLSFIIGFKIHDYVVKATGALMTGVMAQEVVAGHPEMVHMGDDGLYTVDNLSPWVLAAGIQDEQSEIVVLRARVAYLEQRIFR